MTDAYHLSRLVLLSAADRDSRESHLWCLVAEAIEQLLVEHSVAIGGAEDGIALWQQCRGVRVQHVVGIHIGKATGLYPKAALLACNH